jgi:DNA-directed RNA polymerase specialized sigma24 family protein
VKAAIGAAYPGGAMQAKSARIVEQILAALPEQDRQAMLRFYVAGEPADAVCRETGLSEGELRRIKTRAKRRFLVLSRRAQ